MVVVVVPVTWITQLYLGVAIVIVVVVLVLVLVLVVPNTNPILEITNGVLAVVFVVVEGVVNILWKQMIVYQVMEGLGRRRRIVRRGVSLDY